MTCLTALTLACLFQADQLYVTGSVLTPITKGQTDTAVCNGHWCRGPMGELKVGMRINLTDGVALDYGVRHTSFLKEDDRGEESAYVSMTWRPFR